MMIYYIAQFVYKYLVSLQYVYDFIVYVRWLSTAAFPCHS